MRINVFWVRFTVRGMAAGLKSVPNDNLGLMQQLVGGDLERFDMRHVGMLGFSLWMNEMPDRRGIPHNTPFCTVPIYGDFFIARENVSSRIQSVSKADAKKLSLMLKLAFR